MVLTRAEFAEMKHSVHWIAAVYFNVPSFVFGLPILLVKAPSFTESSWPITPFRERVRQWTESMKNRGKRQKMLLTNEEEAYNWFSVVMLVLFFVGFGFRVAAITLTFEEAQATSPPSVTAQVVAYFRAAFRWHNGRWWLGVLTVHTVQYLVHVFHLMACIADKTEVHRAEAIINLPAYALAHIDIFNFAIDIPGIFIKDVLPSHVIVIALNVVAVTLLVFFALAEVPLMQAWSCYPSWYNYEQYDFGMCPAYLSKDNPEMALAPVCTAVNGAICDAEPHRQATAMEHVFASAKIIAIISVGFYLTSIPDKVEYYSIKYREALAIINRNNQVGVEN